MRDKHSINAQALAVLLVAAMTIIGGAVYPPAQARTLSAASSPPQSVSLRLDNVDLVLDGMTLPASSLTVSEAGSAVQIANWAVWGPFREFSIITVPFGSKPGNEKLPAAASGGAHAYRAALQEFRSQQGGRPQDVPAVMLFGQAIEGTRSRVMIPIDATGLKPVVIDEWVVQAGNRLWIVRASQQQSGGSATKVPPDFAFGLRLDSTNPNEPSTLGGMGRTQPAPLVTDAPTGAGLPAPSWWDGDCDYNTYLAAANKGSYRLGAVYLDMPACGPRPWADHAPDVTVHFFPGAWGVYEWECVELSMRFLYLRYGIEPYYANGSQVVWNYPGTALIKISNGTIGRVPQPNDVLSYGSTSTWGHTSVVTSSTVDASGNGTINIIEENASTSGASTLSVTSWVVAGNAGSVSGWLHDPITDPVVTISGNAGIGGALISGTGGLSTTADSHGNYVLTVPYAWSGTVTPSASGYTFSPAFIQYIGLTTSRTGQSYTAVRTFWVGGVSVTADHDIVALGRPEIGSQVMAYDGFTGGSQTMYVPMLFSGTWGSYDAALYVQNVDDTYPAAITIKYYDWNGNLTCTHPDSIPKLSSHGYWIASECVPPGWVGSATITSTRNIVAIGRPHVGTEITSYDGFGSGALSMYVPMLFHTAWGSYESALYVQNVDDTNAADITIKYYDWNGNLTCQRTDNLPKLSAHGYWIADECVPLGWVGGAVITSNYNIVAMARPHVGSQVTAYDGFPGGTLSAYVPMMYSNASGGTQNTALYVQNVDPDYDAHITLDFYDRTGSLTCSKSGTPDTTLGPGSARGYWLAAPTDTCVGNGWSGGVVISSDRNIVAMARPQFGAEVFAYNGFPAGAGAAYVPMLFAKMWGSYNAGYYLMNLDGSNVANLTIKYYDVNGNLTYQASDTLDPHAAKDIWVPDALTP